MEILPIPYNFTVCRVADVSALPLNDEFCFIGKTDEELSLVCVTDSAPQHCIAREDGWRAFRIQGTLDFSLVGILSRISALLAEANIGIFAVSTYNTDYVLTKSENFARALDVLSGAGYTVLQEV